MLLAAACSNDANEPAASVGQTAQLAQTPVPVCGLESGKVGTFVAIPDGAFTAGANPRYPEEGPPRAVSVAAFQIQAHEVTNAQFEQFVAATGYVTDSERTSASSDPGGGSAVFASPAPGAPGAWMLVRNATWRTPGGPGTDIATRPLEPVVHVSRNDAQAYAAWAGGRLPTEDEWEYAAMLGMSDPDNPHAGAFDADGKPIANTWQGIFPVKNEGGDGFLGAAPVGCFQPSAIGLYDMIGNVWEWTDTPYAEGFGTIKGGSYLCAENFCARYRGAARQGQEIDFSSNHIGFRIVKPAAR